jgi:hypothetical protein
MIVAYYREFNQEVIKPGEKALEMLDYIATYGDENYALYEYRLSNTSTSILTVPEELRLREL